MMQRGAFTGRELPRATSGGMLILSQGSMHENVDHLGQKYIVVAPRKRGAGNAKSPALALNLNNMRPYFKLTQQMACEELNRGSASRP